MNQFKAEQIKTVIKDLLKKKSLTYEMVAKEFECSVPTIKRILGKEELSLQRLLQFCDLLETDLGEIEALTKIAKESVEHFTPAQEQFLAKHPGHLSYLMRLYSETPKEIAKEFQLDDRSTDRYLLDLEKQELITVTGRLRVKPRYKSMPSFKAGPLAKAFYEKLIQTLTKFAVKEIGDRLASAPLKDADKTPQGLVGTTSKCREETYREFMKSQEESRKNFFRIADHEEKIFPKEQLKTVVIAHYYFCVDNDNPNLRLLDDSFGSITPLHKVLTKPILKS